MTDRLEQIKPYWNLDGCPDDDPIEPDKCEWCLAVFLFRELEQLRTDHASLTALWAEAKSEVERLKKDTLCTRPGCGRDALIPQLCAKCEQETL